jgi:hypothetical protein
MSAKGQKRTLRRRLSEVGLPIAPEGRGRIPPQAGGLFFVAETDIPMRCYGAFGRATLFPYPTIQPAAWPTLRRAFSSATEQHVQIGDPRIFGALVKYLTTRRKARTLLMCMTEKIAEVRKKE